MGDLRSRDRPRRALRDIAEALQFFTRLPAPADKTAPLDFNRAAWAAPVAGAVVGLVGAAALALARGLGLPPFMCAGLATAALVATTGALHEDGLADAADGFGGGATRERKLDIMRDSRIGAFGGTALALALILRVGALAAALGLGFRFAAAALILASAASRPGALMPLALLGPARRDGAGASAGPLSTRALAAAYVAALIIALALGVFALGVGRSLSGALASAVGAAAMCALAKRQIGGQTGDVAGAAQQWAEIGAWCGLLIGASAT